MGKEREREVIEVDINVENTTRIIGMGVNIISMCNTFGKGYVFDLWEYLTDTLYV